MKVMILFLHTNDQPTNQAATPTLLRSACAFRICLAGSELARRYSIASWAWWQQHWESSLASEIRDPLTSWGNGNLSPFFYKGFIYTCQVVFYSDFFTINSIWPNGILLYHQLGFPWNRGSHFFGNLSYLLGEIGPARWLKFDREMWLIWFVNAWWSRMSGFLPPESWYFSSSKCCRCPLSLHKGLLPDIRGFNLSSIFTAWAKLSASLDMAHSRLECWFGNSNPGYLGILPMKAHEKYASDSAFLDMWIGYLEAEKFWYLQSPWPLSPHLNTTTFSGILYIC